jgi:hypothetical protein
MPAQIRIDQVPIVYIEDKTIEQIVAIPGGVNIIAKAIMELQRSNDQRRADLFKAYAKIKALETTLDARDRQIKDLQEALLSAQGEAGRT